MRIEPEDMMLLMAAMLPSPSDNYINQAMQRDRAKNPYNEVHKPHLREGLEIAADYRLEYARLIMQRA